jgi:hypothetical protein
MSLRVFDQDAFLKRDTESCERETVKNPRDEDVLRRLKKARQKSGEEYPTYRIYDPEGRRAEVKERITYSDGRTKEFIRRRRCNPFVQVFAYEKGADPAVLVGWSREVGLFLKKKMSPTIYHQRTYFDRLIQPDVSKLWRTNTELEVWSPSPSKGPTGGRRKFSVRHPDLDYEMTFRTLPKKWLSEYDDMLKEAQDS